MSFGLGTGSHLEISVRDILGPGLTGTRDSLEVLMVWRAGSEVCIPQRAWLKLLPALSGFGLVFANPLTIWKCAV